MELNKMKADNNVHLAIQETAAVLELHDSYIKTSQEKET